VVASGTGQCTEKTRQHLFTPLLLTTGKDAESHRVMQSVAPALVEGHAGMLAKATEKATKQLHVSSMCCQMERSSAKEVGTGELVRCHAHNEIEEGAVWLWVIISEVIPKLCLCKRMQSIQQRCAACARAFC